MIEPAPEVNPQDVSVRNSSALQGKGGDTKAESIFQRIFGFFFRSKSFPQGRLSGSSVQSPESSASFVPVSVDFHKIIEAMRDAGTWLTEERGSFIVKDRPLLFSERRMFSKKGVDVAKHFLERFRAQSRSAPPEKRRALREGLIHFASSSWFYEMLDRYPDPDVVSAFQDAAFAAFGGFQEHLYDWGRLQYALATHFSKFHFPSMTSFLTGISKDDWRVASAEEYKCFAEQDEFGVTVHKDGDSLKFRQHSCVIDSDGTITAKDDQ